MPSALVGALFAILGAGLAATSAACLVLWRRVRALTPTSVVVPLPRPTTRHRFPLDSDEGEARPASPLPLGEGPGVRVAASPPARKPGSLADRSTGQAPHPGPLPGGEGGRRIVSGVGNDELDRRLDELAGKHRALEARVARVEAASTAAAPGAFGPRPKGARPGRRVDPGSPAGPTLIAVPDLALPPASNSEAAAGLDRRFGPVWAMADSGTPVDAIARETGYPIGQVELILGLRRRLLEAEAGPDA